MEMHDIERVAHALESTLAAARRSADLPGSWFDVVYRGVDTLLPLGMAGGATIDVDAAGVLDALQACLPPENTTPESAHAAASTDSLPEPRAPEAPHAELALPARGPVAQPVPHPPPDPGHRSPEADSVRVAVRKLDALLAQAGELAVARMRIERRLQDLRALRDSVQALQRERRVSRGIWSALARELGARSREVDGLRRHHDREDQLLTTIVDLVREAIWHFRGDVAELGVVSQTISEEVMRARLLPADTVLRQFERMVRDLSRACEKEARLVIEGGNTEIDRKILEQIRDRLMHMLRNAVDHGIELPSKRVAAGKPREGTIGLRVSQTGDGVTIQLSDDGGGLDPERLRRVAVEKGVLTSSEAAALDDQAAIDLIFMPGFSTSPTVTDTSGRGVGMDVVRDNVAAVGGHVEVTSAVAVGSPFSLRIPLTVVTTRAILADVNGTLFAVPTSSIDRLVRLGARDVKTFEGQRVVAIDGQAVAATSLRAVLSLPGGPPVQWQKDAQTPAMVVKHGDTRVALLVHAVPGEEELVVKPLRWPLRKVRHVSGAAVLDSGQTVIVLDASAVVRTAAGLLRRQAGSRPSGPPVDRAAERRRLLVVDDSVTTRTLERSILESAGYEVAAAADGMEALRLLNEGAFDLVVSDVDMPGMDGFTLTAEIRRDDRLRQTPVILVTSLEAKEHMERGLAVGADAYIVKSGFDQGQLLETVSRLL